MQSKKDFDCIFRKAQLYSGAFLVRSTNRQEALAEATEKYGKEAPEFYEEMAAFFAEHDK